MNLPENGSLAPDDTIVSRRANLLWQQRGLGTSQIYLRLPAVTFSGRKQQG